MKRHIYNLLQISLILFFTVFLVSCGGNKVYEDYQKLDKQSWNRFNFLKFEMPVEDIDQDYDIYLVFRHWPEFPHKAIPLTITIYMPSGSERTFDHNVKLYSKGGHQLSECLGDFCDLEDLIRPGLRFSETGIVKFEIENKFTKIETPGIMEVGLIVRKAEEEF